MSWIRSALFNVWFFGITGVLGSYGILLRLFAPGRALALAQLWAGLVLWGARVICGVRLVVSGAEHLPAQGAALIASEHQSAYDTLIWLRLVPRVSYVFKAEMAKWPLFGPLLVPAGQIPVERGGGANAMRSLLRGAEQAVLDSRQILIFPEGTRVEPGATPRLRPGIAAIAARTGLPIIPVATDSGLRWGRRSFRKYAGPVHIWIGPPIPATLPPETILQLLTERWATLHSASRPVDNSVHDRGGIGVSDGR